MNEVTIDNTLDARCDIHNPKDINEIMRNRVGEYNMFALDRSGNSQLEAI
jgi:hypothetical protein